MSITISNRTLTLTLVLLALLLWLMTRRQPEPPRREPMATPRNVTPIYKPYLEDVS